MGKREIIRAAKRKGLSVLDADYHSTITNGEMDSQWEVQFSEDIVERYGENDVQYFIHYKEAVEWINDLKESQPMEGWVMADNPKFWIDVVRTNAHTTDCDAKSRALTNAANAMEEIVADYERQLASCRSAVVSLVESNAKESQPMEGGG